MPTGYTADVGDGKVTDFTDFALACARGFGSLIMLRDSEQSLEATRRYIAEGAYLSTSSYYTQALARAKERLAELESLTDEEALAEAQQAADEVNTSNANSEARRIEVKARYEAMLAQVEAWEPPSDDHASFKAFMGDQLRESIRFDCSPFSMAVPAVSRMWVVQEIDRQRREIERCEQEIENERERNEGRKAWVMGLLDSLEGVPA